MNNSKYSEKFFEINFSHKISKQAYLNACKWLAKNVYGKDELSKYVSVQIIKNHERQLPTFTVSLFITVDERKIKTDFCIKCRNLHSLMYSVESPDCNVCKMTGYRKYLNNEVRNLVQFWKEAFENEEQI